MRRRRNPFDSRIAWVAGIAAGAAAIVGGVVYAVSQSTGTTNPTPTPAPTPPGPTFPQATFPTGVFPTTTPPPTPSTAPQTAHLTIPGGNVAIKNTLPGTQITIVIDGGGTFVDVTESGATVPSALPTLPFFVYTTPDGSGTITIQWENLIGSLYTSTITYS